LKKNDLIWFAVPAAEAEETDEYLSFLDGQQFEAWTSRVVDVRKSDTDCIRCVVECSNGRNNDVRSVEVFLPCGLETSEKREILELVRIRIDGAREPGRTEPPLNECDCLGS